MPIKAFVLIEIAKGEERGVIMALRKLSGVKETEAVTGPYDVIVVVKGTDPDEIGSLVRKLLEWIYHMMRDNKSFKEVERLAELQGKGELVKKLGLVL